MADFEWAWVQATQQLSDAMHKDWKTNDNWREQWHELLDEIRAIYDGKRVANG